MPSIYQVYVEVHREGVENTIAALGAYRTMEEAESQRLHLIDFNKDRKQPPRYWIEEVDTSGLFEVPSRPTPRERFRTRCTELSGQREWTRLLVEVLDNDAVVATYERNYQMYDTFEPFRQGDRMLALVSTEYTATSVMDLDTGEILGGEAPDAEGFCPVGFYVPDWWDVWPAYLLPGSDSWKPHHEWPSGDFGFVWGCVWGDDSSWKVQYLDLSRAAEGIVVREERFGYLTLASRPSVPGSEFIRVSRFGEGASVTFHVPCSFDLATGERQDSGGPILGRW